MNRKTLSILLVGALLLAWIGWNRSQPATEASPEVASPGPSPSAAANAELPQPESLSAVGESAAAHVSDTEDSGESNEVKQARAQLVAAEAELDRLDAEIAAIEAEVDSLEAAGLDPVDFAEEGMARLQPVLQAYLDAQTRYDEAVRTLTAAGVTPPDRPE